MFPGGGTYSWRRRDIKIALFFRKTLEQQVLRGIYPLDGHLADIEGLFNHTHVRREIRSSAVLILSDEAGNAFAKMAAIRLIFVPEDPVMPVVEPALDGIDSLFGFDLPHTGHDPFLQLEPEPFLDVVGDSHRS